jgi:putative pyoverdin transport system ATP-binding/permease protein
MRLIWLLLKSSRVAVLIALLSGALSGAAMTGLLSLINQALAAGSAARTLAWAFVGLGAMVLLAQMGSQLMLASLQHGAMQELRLRLSRQILATPLRQIEKLGQHRLLSMLADDVLLIGQGLTVLPFFVINVAVVAGCLVYLAWLSPHIFLMMLGFLLVGVMSSRLLIKWSMRYFQQARQKQDVLYKHLQALLHGLKELKLHRMRRRAFLEEELTATTQRVRQLNVTSNRIYAINASWTLFLVFMVLGLLLFVVPLFSEVDTRTLTGFTLVVLYIQQPLDAALTQLRNLGQGEISLQKLQALSLEEPEPELPAAPGAPRTFQTLEFSEVTHAYRRELDDGSFIVGPVNLTIQRGELLFIVGGNGSGKTTLAKLITGLYEPEQGEILLDGERVTPERREDYRQLFSAIFSDYFLFERLLGLAPADVEQKVRGYLTQLQIDHKVRLTEGALSTTELSQGQRKRLALLAAYLEDRPFYMFDEWAADQDPAFKDIFYLDLLPELKRRGKTVVVISHDDRYLHVADRVLKLDSGKLISQDAPHVLAS